MIDTFESAYTTIDAADKCRGGPSLPDVTPCHILYYGKTNTLGIVYDTAPSVGHELLLQGLMRLRSTSREHRP